MITYVSEETATLVVVTCRFCEKWDNEPVPATHLAGQWEGGDVDEDPVWVPVCAYHAANWYGREGDEEWRQTPPESRLPLVDLDVKGALTPVPPPAPPEGERHTSIRASLAAVAG